jgi:regulator of replication initiation timing
MTEEANDIVIKRLQNRINELDDEKKELEFKVKSTMAKNERLERENEMLRKQIEENTWNEIDKDDNDDR